MKSLLTTVLILSAGVSAFADHTQFERAPFVAHTALAPKACPTPVKAPVARAATVKATPAKAEPHSRSYPSFIGSSYSAPKSDASIKPAVPARS